MTIANLPIVVRNPCESTDARPADATTERSVVATVLRHALRNVLRNRGVLAFGAGMLLLTDVAYRLTGSASRTLTTVLDVVLFVVPLVTLMFGIISWHSSREFNELLLAQPVRRRSLFTGLYLSLVLPLAAAFALGVLLPLALHRAVDAASMPLLLSLVASGVALTLVFGGLALLIGVLVEDRLRGVMAGLAVWMVLTIGYDAVVLTIATTLSDYPLERPMLAFMLGNPVDLARSMIVLQSDTAALMGYTGAVLHQFLGTALGTMAAVSGLLLWIITPAWLAGRAFERRDF